jgi:hypothetical protein
MIKRIVVLLKDSTLRWTILYICWDARIEVISFDTQSSLITSRDCNHITWFRNSASVSLFATLSQRTWIANDFSSSQLFQKRSKLSDCIFWKFSYKRNFSFLFISCTRNRHSTMIENYIKRNDVIKCELNRLTFIKIWFIIELSQIIVAKRANHCHKVIQITFTDLCHEVR